MSKIEDLIRELCPEGVVHQSIGAVSELIRGTRVTKKDLLLDGKYPVVSGGIGYMGFIDEFNREAETITIAQYGTAGFVKWQPRKFWANDVCFSLVPNEKLVLKRYMYFILTSRQSYLYEISNRSAIPYSIDRERILSISIPVPPIRVQQEIVKVLDTFIRLEEELEAELQARKKQYEYYRDKLLTFKDLH